VLQRPGAPIEAGTREFMELRFGTDFGDVRVHTGDVAARATAQIGAAAFTAGRHIAFGTGRYAPAGGVGRELLAHELAHVIQQRGGDRALRRAPLPDESEPRTIIIAYGSGQVNPTTNAHNVGLLFKKVAAQKLAETKARLGKNVAKHTIVFEYTPTEVELQAVLNRKYAAPVAEIHIFSHGWSEGVNLGGPVPEGPRPADETPQDTDQRRLQTEDFGEYSIQFADDAVVVFYGCNVGNAAGAGDGSPLAQDFADQYGVTVTASNKSTHFESSGGWHQVPDAGGKMLDFVPSATAAQLEVNAYLGILARLAKARRALNEPAPKLGLLGFMIREDRLQRAIAEQEKAATAKRDLAHRMLGFVAASTRDAKRAEVEKAEAAVGMSR